MPAAPRAPTGAPVGGVARGGGGGRLAMPAAAPKGAGAVAGRGGSGGPGRADGPGGAGK